MLACGATAFLVPALGCSGDVRIERRPVRLFVPRACALESGPNAARPYAQVYASGDFDPSRDAPAFDGAFFDTSGIELPRIPPEARALAVDLAQGERRWRGAGEVGEEGPIDVLLLPERACALTGALGARRGSTVAPVDAVHLLVVGGAPRADGGTIPETFLANLGTGRVERLDGGLLTPRLSFAVTRFGDGALVSGGLALGGSEPLATAEVFALAAPGTAGGAAPGDFERTPIALSTPRADHGAVELVTGETLLVGGRGPSGLVRTLEVIDPITRRARTAGLVQLSVPRLRPSVLRLANGEVLVAGGFDETGAPVPTLEWLSPDARRTPRRARDLVAANRHAFVALDGGGALAVLAPEAPPPDFRNVWRISADGTLEDATPIARSLSDVKLFPATEGAPVLWTGDRWLRWEPWAGQFGPFLGGEALGPPGDASAAVPGGALVWLDEERSGDASLFAFRYATRGPYAPQPSALLVEDTRFVAPDRLVSPGVTRALSFREGEGLTLAQDASVFLTDVTYADFTTEVFAPSSEPPLIVVRDERGDDLVVGGESCPVAFPPNVGRVRVVRRGAAIRVTTDERESSCPASPAVSGRVRLGLRGAAGRTSFVRGWTVSRSAGK